MPKKTKIEQGIPKHVLHALTEYTPGGFLLFTFNQETGFPEYRMTFDSPPFYLAMSKYVSDWTTAMNKIHVAVAGNDIGQIITSPPDSDEDGAAGTPDE
jgi:hypothetical protein